MLIFIEVGIDKIFEEVVPGLGVKVNVIVHLLLVPDLWKLSALDFSELVKGCERFSERLLYLLKR
jgi:hypothetical protein